MASIARPISSGLTTALIYVRVSSEDQRREGLSLDAQLADCRRYAARQGWGLGDEYLDVMKGTRDDRPRYQQLLAAIRSRTAAGQATVVVVAALDRLGRRMIERLRSREELKSFGVAVHTVREGGEVSDLTANILASVAQEEVRRLGERVKASFEQIGQSGWTKGGAVAFGYVLRDRTDDERASGAPHSVLEPDLAAVGYLVEAFERVAAGATMRSVQRWLMELPESVRDGRQFSFRAVQKMLKCHTYTARTPKGGVGKWPALIDAALFERVQEQIASHKHMPHQASRRYLASGLVRCPHCGSRMRAASSRNRYGVSMMYRCRGGHDKGAEAASRTCSGIAGVRQVDAAILAAVTDILTPVLTTDTGFLLLLEREWELIRNPPAALDSAKEIARLDRNQTKNEKRLGDAAMLLVDGTLDRAGYAVIRERIQGEIAATDAELSRLRGLSPAPVSLPPFSEVLAQVGGWESVLSAGDITAQRAVLGLLIDHVVPVRVGHGKYGVIVEWTSLGASLSAVANAGAKWEDRGGGLLRRVANTP